MTAYAIRKGHKWRVLDSSGKPVKKDGKPVDNGGLSNQSQAEYVADKFNKVKT